MAHDNSYELILDDFYCYRLDKLGRGSFGSVFKGRQISTNIIVAIKEIQKVTDQEIFLKREEHILKELSDTRHENLVGLIKSIDTPDNFYLIMEYCNFGDLDTYLHHRRRLDTETLQHFFKQIAKALYVMSKKGIIHRDLKPQNILLCKPSDQNAPHPLEITVKITDFGVSRFLNSHELANTLCGSPRYMAPEILLELPYCQKVDYWSVGIMLYECAVGAVSFIRASWSLDTLKKFYVEDGDLNLQVPLGTSKRLQELLASLLVIDPSKRMDIESFLVHPFFDYEWSTVIVPSETPSSRRSPNTTFECIDIDDTELPEFLMENQRLSEETLIKYDDHDKTLIASTLIPNLEEKSLFTVIALYDFNGRVLDELSFKEDEIFYVLYEPTNIPEFYTVKNYQNKIGYVPKNYVKILEKNDINIQYLPYFYGKMTRYECEYLFNKQGEIGDFLLRESRSKPGNYSLSVKYQPKNKHFLIKKCPYEPSKFIVGDWKLKFDTMEELVEHYTKEIIYKGPYYQKLKLRKPLLKNQE